MSPRGASVPPFPPGYRASGVLLHVTSLPSPYGIGDLGPAAFAWVDRLHEAGQRWWQALPLGPTGYGDSPYQCLSSFAGNELLISPDGLIDDGLLRAADCAHDVFSPFTVEYEKVVPFKVRNWRWRCTEEMLSTRAFEWLRDLTKMSRRSNAMTRTTTNMNDRRGAAPDSQRT